MNPQGMLEIARWQPRYFADLLTAWSVPLAVDQRYSQFSADRTPCLPSQPLPPAEREDEGHNVHLRYPQVTYNELAWPNGTVIDSAHGHMRAIGEI